MAAKKSRDQKERRLILEIIHEEVRFLSETYFRAIEGLDGKAANLFGFAVIIAGVCAGSSPFIIDKVEQNLWFIRFFVGGVILLVFSAILSLWAYQVKRRALGPSLATFEKIEKIRSRKKIIEELNNAYYECIDYNSKVVRSKSKKIKFSLGLMLVGISIILADVLIFGVVI